MFLLIMKAPDREIYRCTLNGTKFRLPANDIKKIILLGTIDEDVFDIVTENHNFSAGPGKLIIHNGV